jgi:hypothetical protein
MEFEPTSPLRRDQTYYWRARAKDAGEIWGGWSQTWSFRVPSDVVELQSPSDSAVLPPGSGILKWSEHEAATSYRLQISRHSDFSIVTLDRAVNNLQLNIADVIIEDALHYWRVAPIDSMGTRGDYSAVHSFALDPDAAAPPVVTGPEITNNLHPTWTWTLPIGSTSVRYRLGDSPTWTVPDHAHATTFTPAAGLTEGIHSLLVQARNEAGVWSAAVSHTITVDTTPPSIPSVSGPALTNESVPVWTIDDGTGSWHTLRYQLDGQDDSSWTTIHAVLPYDYSPGRDLASGSHTLYVQAADRAGNWSDVASSTVVVDLDAPDAPVVTGVSVSELPRPTWEWSIDQETAVVRYQLNGVSSDGWEHQSDPSVATFKPSTDLPEGEHTLYVQAGDQAGSWSLSGHHTVLIDRPEPPAPTVTPPGNGLTNDTTPTWLVSSELPNLSAFRYQVDTQDPANWTHVSLSSGSSTTLSPELSGGSHILYVQVCDVPGNWSPVASADVIVDTLIPPPPEVTGSAETWKPRPEWSWHWDSVPTDIAQIRYSIVNASFPGTYTATIGPDSRSFTPTSSLPQGPTTFSVQVGDEAGNWSVPVTLTTEIDSTEIGLAWDPHPEWQNQGVVGYRVYRRSGSGWLMVATAEAVEAPSATITGLTIGETYEFAVTAHTDLLESDHSESLTYIPGETYE